MSVAEKTGLKLAEDKFSRDEAQYYALSKSGTVFSITSFGSFINKITEVQTRSSIAILSIYYIYKYILEINQTDNIVLSRNEVSGGGGGVCATARTHTH